MPDHDLVIANLRPPDGRAGAHVAVSAGRIAALGDGPPSPAAETLDGRGHLVLPALADAHLHLDKALFGVPWQPHAAGPTRLERIETDARVLPHLPLSTSERAAALIRRSVTHGTLHLRSRVDIAPAFGLRALEGVLEAKAAHAHACTVQIVAFPQAGVVRAPGTLELLDAALGAGADLLRCLDPCEVDRDPRGQLDALIALAERRGVGLDIHLHESGELGLFSLSEFCARVRAHGMGGLATVSRGFCLGGVVEPKQKAAAAMMAEAGVALTTHGAGGAPPPPISLLRAGGVTVLVGNDNMRDTWTPYGTADMLERAAVLGWRSDWRTDDLLHDLFGMVSAGNAAAPGVAKHGLAPGAPASFFTVRVERAPEAIAQHPPRRLVVFAGRVVARDGAFVG